MLIPSKKTHEKIYSDLQMGIPKKKDYIKEYIYIIAFVFLFCLIVSIFTYDPNDPSTFHRLSNSPEKISNYFGPFGASFADWAFQIFGLGAIIFLMVFLVQLLFSFRYQTSKSSFYLKVFGYPQLILFYLGFVSGIKPLTNFKGMQILTGGVIGNKIFDLCAEFFGTYGALAVLSLGALSSLTLCLGITPLSSVLWFLKFTPSKHVKNFTEHVINEHNPILDDFFDANQPIEKRRSAVSYRADQNVFLDLLSVLEVREILSFKNILQSEEFQRIDYLLPLACGKTRFNKAFILDLTRLPNLLIIDTTNTEKNLCVNILMISLMINKPPSELRLILIDPHMIEFSPYEGVGHLLTPVITSSHKCIAAFTWLIDEMEKRYIQMKQMKVRNFATLKNVKSMPYLVMIISEFYDLIVSMPYELEENLQKILHKAHFVGIHLIFSTKKPTQAILGNAIQSSFFNRLQLYKNKTIFVTPEKEDPIEVDNIHISINEIRELANKLRILYPLLPENMIMK